MEYSLVREIWQDSRLQEGPYGFFIKFECFNRSHFSDTMLKLKCAFPIHKQLKWMNS